MKTLTRHDDVDQWIERMAYNKREGRKVVEGRLKAKVDSNSGMLALLHRNQDLVSVLSGELALICTSSLVSMQLVGGDE